MADSTAEFGWNSTLGLTGTDGNVYAGGQDGEEGQGGAHSAHVNGGQSEGLKCADSGLRTPNPHQRERDCIIFIMTEMRVGYNGILEMMADKTGGFYNTAVTPKILLGTRCPGANTISTSASKAAWWPLLSYYSHHPHKLGFGVDEVTLFYASL